MSDFTLKEDWFHSDLLKIFALNILKNSQGVEIRGINMEQYSFQRQCQGQNCGREIFTFNQLSSCLVGMQIRVDEIEITHKRRTRYCTTDLNELNNRISFAEKKHNELIHEVLIRYYDLGEALSKEYIRFFNMIITLQNT
ncbi:38778_t:CDS:2, partial [Gigaspora margarita]